MQQTFNLGPEYDHKMLQALFDALTAEGAQTIDQRTAEGAGSQEIGYWKFQLDRGTVEVNAETYLGISLSGPVDLVARLTPIIQDKILSAFPGRE
ncbi:MAG TPA: hypothetical protein VFF70_08840 [Anaerolineae bacterium]|jgi:hypothetical protein|nr:hypothetical protein [Anaerolineae bacterium]